MIVALKEFTSDLATDDKEFSENRNCPKDFKNIKQWYLLVGGSISKVKKHSIHTMAQL